MIKRVLLIGILFVILCPIGAYADTAQRTKTTLYVNTEKADYSAMQAMSVVTINSYNINGNNYYKLRDIAHILSNNNMGFSVEWDSKEGIIKIDTTKPYTSLGNELDNNRNNENIQYTSFPQKTKISINNKNHEITAYNIEGNNYFQLRELGDLIGFRVNWLESEKAVQILSKDRSAYTNIVPEHFTAGDLIQTTGSANTYILEGTISAEQYQFSSPIPVEQGKNLTFELNTLEYDSGKIKDEDEPVLRVICSDNDESNRWGFNFMPRSLHRGPDSFPAMESENYHITLVNLSGGEVKYRFTVTIVSYRS